MRQLHVDIPSFEADRVLALAAQHEAEDSVAIRARRRGGEERAIVYVSLTNPRVGPFASAVAEAVSDARIIIVPRGVLPLRSPLTNVQDQVTVVGHRSTLELVLSALQSIGSWWGMLLYALFSGIVAAYGVIGGASYLLVAAMLIAPMGAPAMVSVTGAAIGDWRMVGRGLLRFWTAVLVLVASAAALGLAYRLHASTALMEQITALSAWSVLVAAVAGAAGAQSQVESERASLVTGTATGFLIAAALSPTSAVLGLSLVLRRWDYVGLMGFQLALQYVAILAGGWVLVTGFGVRPGQPTVGRGSQRMRWAIAAAAVVATVSLVAWQIRQGPRFQKADAVRDAAEVARQAVGSLPNALLVDSSVRFTTSSYPQFERETMLVQLVVAAQGAEMDREALESRVRDVVRARLRAKLPNVAPFIVVTAVPGPPAQR